MINIYRKVRKELAAENKPKKYLRYAIGEILLVVIGILIALQINNWNEENNRKRSAEQHLKSLQKNIKEDLVQLEQLKLITDTTLVYSNSLTRQFKTLDPIDSNTSLYITSLVLERSLSPNKSSLESLNTSGQLAYLSEKIQSQIFNYYNLLEKIEKREEISNTFIKIRYEPYFFDRYNFVFSKENNWDVLKQYYIDDPRNIPLFDKDKFLVDKKLEAMVFGRHFQMKQQNELYKEAMQLANILVSNIDNKQ